MVLMQPATNSAPYQRLLSRATLVLGRCQCPVGRGILEPHAQSLEDAWIWSENSQLPSSSDGYCEHNKPTWGLQFADRELSRTDLELCGLSVVRGAVVMRRSPTSVPATFADLKSYPSSHDRIIISTRPKNATCMAETALSRRGPHVK